MKTIALYAVLVFGAVVLLSGKGRAADTEPPKATTEKLEAIPALKKIAAGELPVSALVVDMSCTRRKDPNTGANYPASMQIRKQQAIAEIVFVSGGREVEAGGIKATIPTFSTGIRTLDLTEKEVRSFAELLAAADLTAGQGKLKFTSGSNDATHLMVTVAISGQYAHLEVIDAEGAKKYTKLIDEVLALYARAEKEGKDQKSTELK